MNLEGKLLGSRYQIEEKIGNGGMATVYRAKDLILNRFVAVKILRDEFTTDNEFIKRFQIEAQSVASLSHHNIVSVYDVGQEGNLYYIVMELIKGKTLKEIINEDGKLSWKWAAKVAKQIASALEGAHKNKIVHRDIKPHNIIITEEGIAKVMDFGIAKAVSNSTITAFGTTIGSVHYFSPEHAKGSYTDEKSDIYSLGVVLYEMVTGKVPFDADTPVSVALKHMQEVPVPPIEINSAIPRCINDIILKAMAKEANDRFSSATEMKLALEVALKNPSSTVTTTIPVMEQATQRIQIPKQEETKEKHSSKKKKENKFVAYLKEHAYVKFLLALITLAIIFLSVVVIVVKVGDARKPKDIQIPNFTNMTLEQAKQVATENKLVLHENEPKFHVEIPEGQIISQEPPYQANYTIKEGSTVKVTVSKGQEIVKVEKVVGSTKDEAYNKLKDLGFEIVINEEFDKEVEKGYVIEQDLKEGEEVLAGTTITLKVSAGIEQVEVPNLLGLTEEEAKQAIVAAKLKWKRTDKVEDNSQPNGKIVNQSISSGSTVDEDTEITITLNEYNETKNGSVVINIAKITGYKETYTDEPILDENGEQVIDEVTGQPKTEKKLVAPKNVRLKVTVNGDAIFDQDVSESEVAKTIKVAGTGNIEIKVYVGGVLKNMGNTTLNLNVSDTLTVE